LPGVVNGGVSGPVDLAPRQLTYNFSDLTINLTASLIVLI